MEPHQKALIVVARPSADAPEAESNVQALNDLLQKGWRVAQSTPMGGAGAADAACFASLVILERDRRAEAAALVEEADEALDTLLEGDGAGVEVTPEVAPEELEVEPGRTERPAGPKEGRGLH